jgi:hypothetical protein
LIKVAAFLFCAVESRREAPFFAFLAEKFGDFFLLFLSVEEIKQPEADRIANSYPVNDLVARPARRGFFECFAQPTLARQTE